MAIINPKETSRMGVKIVRIERVSGPSKAVVVLQNNYGHEFELNGVQAFSFNEGLEGFASLDLNVMAYDLLLKNIE